jgi:hypothetical protein
MSEEARIGTFVESNRTETVRERTAVITGERKVKINKRRRKINEPGRVEIKR